MQFCLSVRGFGVAIGRRALVDFFSEFGGGMVRGTR